MAVFAGAPDILSAGARTKRQLKALQKYFLPTQQVIQDAAEAITPQEQNLFARMFGTYAPIFSQVGTQIAGQEQLGNILNDLAAIRGGGNELVNALLQQDRLANPEFYQQRELANRGIQQLLAAQDPSRLSGSELTEIERGLNRLNTSRGNINVTDATTTAANAGAFGSALAGKQARFGQALSLIPSLSAASRSPINTTALGLGKSSAPNIGTSTWTYNPATSAAGAGQAFQNQFGQAQGQIAQMQQEQPSTMDVIHSGYNSATGPCSCYIFKEHYGYPDVPQYMRWVRDYFYQRTPSIGKGYRQMAYWLVPLMRKWRIIRLLVTHLMIFPLAHYAQYLTGGPRWKKVFWPFKKVWLKVWEIYGKY